MYNERNHKKGGLPVLRKRNDVSVRGRGDEDSPIIKAILRSSLLGILASVLSGGVLLTFLCFFAIRAKDPLSLRPPLSLLALLPSNFFGGFISAKKSKCSPIACGAITAAMWMILSLAVAVCLPYPASNHALWQSISLHVASVLFCVLGAFAGSYKPVRDTRKKRRFSGK